MTISKDNQISKNQLLLRFQERVRDFVVSSTSWVSSTVIRPGVTLGAITGSEAQSTATPAAENISAVTDIVTANLNSTQSIVRAFRDIMVVYSRNNKISVRNLGNSPGGLDYVLNGGYRAGDSVPNYNVTETAVVRLSTDNGTATLVSSDVTTAANTRNLNSKDNQVDASNLESFFTDCRNIWSNRCNNASLKTYDYNYCHGSFGAHSSHGSRSRR
jgi:hypothetical protein